MAQRNDLTLNNQQKLYILKSSGRYIAKPGSTTNPKYAIQFTGAEAQRKIASLSLSGLKVEMIPVEVEE